LLGFDFLSIGKIDRFGIESIVKMVHINLTSILFSTNTLNVMKKSIENGKEGEVNKMGIIF
jgi:hypothetical protein